MGILSFLSRKARVPADLRLYSDAETRPAAGLIVIGLEVGPSPRGLRFELQRQEEVLFSKSIPPHGAPSGGWIAIHGQLLPNGEAEVTGRLIDGGQVVAETPLRLRVQNAEPLRSQVAESLRRSRAPAVVDGSCDSRDYDYADPSLRPWFDRPDAMEHIEGLLASGKISAGDAERLRAFVTNGFLVLPDVIDSGLLKDLNAALDDVVDKKVDGYEDGSSERIHGLHDRYPAIKALWLHPEILRMLDLIFGQPARPCQSLTYVFGSQQEHHQDTIHLTPFPAGYMCGVWTALEDVQEGAGELRVFPGSHRLERLYMADLDLPKVGGEWSAFGEKAVPAWTRMLEAGRFRSEAYLPKAGTVLIWHENLMHGGAPRRDSSVSRRSIVGHYFAEGCVAYYDSSGLPGVLRLDPRTT